jgi:hypothetical protein
MHIICLVSGDKIVIFNVLEVSIPAVDFTRFLKSSASAMAEYAHCVTWQKY